MLVHNLLVGVNPRDRIRLGASAKIITAFDIARTMAIGADWCNAARGFMFGLGCIQAQTCHTGFCPTGVTTQDPRRMRALVTGDKAERVHNFHQNTLKALSMSSGAFPRTRCARFPRCINGSSPESFSRACRSIRSIGSSGRRRVPTASRPRRRAFRSQASSAPRKDLASRASSKESMPPWQIHRGAA